MARLLSIIQQKNSQALHKQLLLIAIPMIFSNITTPLLGLVDTAVIGHLEHAYYLGGIAVGSMIITMIFWLAGSLRMSVTGVISQAIGELDDNKAWDYFCHALAIAFIAAVCLVLFQKPIMEIAFFIIGGSEQVQFYGREYFAIRIYSSPAALMNLVVLGYFIASQRVKWVVLQLVVINLINISLDLWFVLGLKWGVKGVAIASVIADYCGLMLLVLVLKQELIRHFKAELKWRLACFKELFQLNNNIFIRSVVLQLCLVYITIRGAELGDVTLAANAILLNLFIFISYGLDGFAYAAESLVGQAYGDMKKSKRNNHLYVSSWQMINQIVKVSAFWSALIGIFFAITLLLWGNFLVRTLTDLSNVLLEVDQYLPWIILVSVVAWLPFLFDGVYIGLTHSKTMRNMMIFSGIVFFLLIGIFYSWGNHGLWLAFTGFMLIRGLSLAWDYRRISMC